jgi:hypothetical protein
VRVAWRGHKLGYVPRAENAPVARLLDAGQPLQARILAVGDEDNWAPIEFAIAHARDGV